MPASKHDSITKCYGPTQLRAIARKLISGRECDTLLKVANATIADQDTVIMSLQQAAVKQDDRWVKTSHLVTMCEDEKIVLKKEIKKTKRRLVWTKIGWATTSVILVITTVLALIT